MLDDYKDYVLIGLILVIGIGIGICGREIYDATQELSLRTTDGLRIGGVSESVAHEIAQDYDANGDWILVNVNGMSYDRAIEVCRHETFHEIWAECGEKKNLTSCIKKYEEETKKYQNLSVYTV